MPEPTVVHRAAKDRASGRFELERAGKKIGYLSYALEGKDTMLIEYVEVDPAQRGGGMGARLVEAAVVWAREQRRVIVPLCGYARSVMRRTAAYQDVLKA